MPRAFNSPAPATRHISTHTTSSTLSATCITPAPIHPYGQFKRLRLQPRQASTTSSSTLTTVNDPADRRCLISCPAGSRCLIYQGAPNYGGCCPFQYTTCDIQTTCKARADHTRTFSNTYGDLVSGTFFCGASDPYCQTLVYEDAVSFGKGLTVAHCVPQSDYDDTPNGLGFYSCLQWTTGEFCTNGKRAAATTSVSNSTLSTAAATGAGALHSSTSSPAASNGGSSQLSTGAIVGITIGSFIIGLIVAAVFVFVWKGKRGFRRITGPPQPVELGDTEFRAEMPPRDFYANAMELEGNGISKAKEKGQDEK